jgi:guanylate kinase
MNIYTNQNNPFLCHQVPCFFHHFSPILLIEIGAQYFQYRKEKTMNKKIMIVGRSGCGKDTLAYCLTKNHNLKQLISITTRPPRYTGETAHIFVSEDEANQMTDRVAETVINGYQYFATRAQLDECDVYVVDPKGLSDVCERAPETKLTVVYVQASTKTRRKRAIDRAEDKEEAAKVFDKRHQDEDPMFTQFEKLIENNDLTEFHKNFPTVSTVITLQNESANIGAMDKKSEIVMMLNNQLTFGSEFEPHIDRI